MLTTDQTRLLIALTLVTSALKVAIVVHVASVLL